MAVEIAIGTATVAETAIAAVETVEAIVAKTGAAIAVAVEIVAETVVVETVVVEIEAEAVID